MIRTPTQPAPIPPGKKKTKSKKRQIEEDAEARVPLEKVSKTEVQVVDEGEQREMETVDACLLNLMNSVTSMDDSTQTEFVAQLVCPFHPTVELKRRNKDTFYYYYCPKITCAMFSPEANVKDMLEKVEQQTHSEVAYRWDELACYCDRVSSLRCSRSVKNPDRLFLACRDRNCDFFLWLNVPLSNKIRDRINHVVPQPAVPLGQTSIQAFVLPPAQPLVGPRPQYPSPRIGRSVPDEFEMCDNGYNTLTAPFIFEGLRYREWMKEAWRKFSIANFVLREDPTDERLKQERERLLREAWGRYEQDEGRHPETARVLNELYRRILLGETVPRVVGWFTDEERRALKAQLPVESRAFAETAFQQRCEREKRWGNGIRQVLF